MILSIILLLFSQIMFPITFKYDTGENLVTKKKEEDTKERQIKSLLDAIRKHNNNCPWFQVAQVMNFHT